MTTRREFLKSALATIAALPLVGRVATPEVVTIQHRRAPVFDNMGMSYCPSVWTDEDLLSSPEGTTTTTHAHDWTDSFSFWDNEIDAQYDDH